jgi:hypothetical protein
VLKPPRLAKVSKVLTGLNNYILVSTCQESLNKGKSTVDSLCLSLGLDELSSLVSSKCWNFQAYKLKLFLLKIQFQKQNTLTFESLELDWEYQSQSILNSKQISNSPSLQAKVVSIKTSISKTKWRSIDDDHTHTFQPQKNHLNKKPQNASNQRDRFNREILLIVIYNFKFSLKELNWHL